MLSGIKLEMGDDKGTIFNSMDLRTLTDELRGSIPFQATIARIAQLVERQFSKLRVASSNLVSRSTGELAQLARALRLHRRGHRFESDILHDKEYGDDMELTQ